MDRKASFKYALGVHDSAFLRAQMGKWIADGVKEVRYRGGGINKMWSINVLDAIEVTAKELLRREGIDARPE